MTMEDWATRLDEFLRFTDREVLRDSGKVSMEMGNLFSRIMTMLE